MRAVIFTQISGRFLAPPDIYAEGIACARPIMAVVVLF